ncbi:unnamed protein product [Zymoseptoria tritici ST99CH_1A5]|nr:unnamed protein product [Zymoseptoria tritici ST99CH_1A5]
MRFFTSLAALSLAFSSTFAAPVEQNEHTLETRQSGIVLTTGAQGNILVRKEIRQLKDQNLDQWTLFILAMKSWYTQSQSSSTSFFGMANIHGVPMGNYNGVGQCSNCNGATGYGVHDSILFPPWHRVYLAHFEQELIKVAKNVANSYPASGNNGWTRSRMVTAANNLRLPYWDWAAKVPSGRPAMPLMFTDTTVTVWDATGQKTYENPLYTFRINDPSGVLYTPFVNWRQTYRWPNNNSNNPSSQTGKMASAFANARQGYADQVYSLFTQCDDYLHWSNDQAGSSSTRCSTSIEAVHNNVHNIVGGPPGSVSGGHMTYLPLGAMDPTFFLHHANVDRYFAMWQRTHPNQWLGDQAAPSTSWTISRGYNVNGGTPLTPFFYDGYGNFWKSDQVRDWTVLKYTYPEFANSDGSAASINRYINNLYGPNAGAVAGSSKRQILSGVQAIVNKTSTAIEGTAKDIMSGNPLKAANGTTYQYFANLQAPRNSLGGSYTVYLFNGQPSSAASDYPLDSKLIGSMAVTSVSPNSPGGGMGDNGVIVSSSVPLTRALQSQVSSSGLASLAEPLVGPFLTKNLVVKIIGPTGNAIDPKSLDGFSCEVAGSTAQLPSDPSVLPVFSEFVKLISIV